MTTITKNYIVEEISEKIPLLRKLEINSKDVQKVIQELLDRIKGELTKGNRLEFRKFGVFFIHENPERMAQNPATLEKVKVPRRFRVKFKPGKIMKEKITKNGINKNKSSNQHDTHIT